MLLSHGASFGSRDNYWRTPLHSATIHWYRAGIVSLPTGSPQMRRDIIDICDNGDTALHNTASTGFVELVGAFLEKGASTTLKSKYGTTPIDLATNKGKRELLSNLDPQMG
jgi:ankyrin repeat protein